MDTSLKYEINSCISELESIVRQLRAVSDDIDRSIDGMYTGVFTNGLNWSADRYESAAKKLRKIK